METLPYHPLVIVTEEDIKKARQLYGIGDVNQIKESLASIEEWFKKQDHLAEASKYLSKCKFNYCKN